MSKAMTGAHEYVERVKLSPVAKDFAYRGFIAGYNAKEDELKAQAENGTLHEMVMKDRKGWYQTAVYMAEQFEEMFKGMKAREKEVIKALNEIECDRLGCFGRASTIAKDAIAIFKKGDVK